MNQFIPLLFYSTIFIACVENSEIEINRNSKETDSSTNILTTIDTNVLECVLLSYQDSNKIYNMQLTAKHSKWDNPTCGGAIHINENDEIEIYQFGFREKSNFSKEMIDSNGNYKMIPIDTFIVVEAKDINRYTAIIGFGNPRSILITSEFNLKQSKSLKLILDEVNEYYTQIFFLKKK